MRALRAQVILNGHRIIGRGLVLGRVSVHAGAAVLDAAVTVIADVCVLCADSLRIHVQLLGDRILQALQVFDIALEILLVVSKQEENEFYGKSTSKSTGVGPPDRAERRERESTNRPRSISSIIEEGGRCCKNPC